MKRSSSTALIFLAFAAIARAGDDGTPKLPLDQLLETPISTAAKYDQQLASVAASVTVITAEDIERYGWTTLAEALQSVRGFYVTYDRSDTYIGLRGISRPTDYNSRLLIMVDGHPLNDPIFGMAPAGDNMALDLSMVEKIEIIRGPGSALYGTHAMLAVINVFTKQADAIDGVRLSAIAGSDQREGAAFQAGKVFANGLRLTASAYWQEINGKNLYFPEFDTPETNHGVAEKLDYSDSHRFAMTLEKDGFKLGLSTRRSIKGKPTAEYDTVFNTDSGSGGTQQLVTADYRRAFGGNKSFEVRSYWDRDRSGGFYPYDDLGVDRWKSDEFGAEGRLQWDLTPNHRFTGGVEYRDEQRAQYTYVVGDYKIDLRQPSDSIAYYVQYEGHPSPKLGFVAGVRRDDFSATNDSTNPRAAILFTPNRSTTLKLLYGSAFRSPNVYESNYSDSLTPWKAHPDLKPETIRTTELALEQRLSPETLMVASAFHISANQLIDEELEPTSQTYWYNNVGSLKSNGVEVAIHMRRQDGLWAHLSGSAQQTESDGKRANNSPRYLLKGGLSTSPWARWHAGVEGVYEAARRTRDGEDTNPFLLINGVVSRQLSTHFRLALTSHNLLNTAYSTPAGPEFRPQAIRQDGRTFTMRLTYTR